MNFRTRALIVAAIASGILVFALHRRQVPDPIVQGRAASVWVKDLLSSDYRTRNEAQAILVGLGEAAVPQVCVLLQARTPFWQPYLGRFGSILPFLTRTPEADAALCRQRGAELIYLLGPRGRAAIPDLVNSLAYPDAAPEAERALLRLGHQSEGELVRALQDRNVDVRRHSARLLKEFVVRDEQCIGPLIAALRDDQANVRREAILTLGAAQARQGEVAAALLPKANDAVAEVRASAFAALGTLKSTSPESLTVIRAGLYDSIPSVRLEAAKACWSLTGDSTAVVPVLIGVLSTQEGWQAAYALGNMGPAAAPAIPALIEALRRERVPRAFRTPPSTAFALGQIQEAAIPALLQVLNDREPAVRLAAVLAFNFMGRQAQAAVPELVTLLRDPDPEVRQVTAITLAGTGANRDIVLAGLTDCLRAEDIYLRSAAAALLREIAPEQDWIVSPE